MGNTSGAQASSDRDVNATVPPAAEPQPPAVQTGVAEDADDATSHQSGSSTTADVNGDTGQQESTDEQPAPGNSDATQSLSSSDSSPSYPSPSETGYGSPTDPPPPPPPQPEEVDNQSPAPEPSASMQPPPPPPPETVDTPEDENAIEPDGDGEGYTLEPEVPINSQPDLAAASVDEPAHPAAAVVKMLPLRAIDAPPPPKAQMRWKVATDKPVEEKEGVIVANNSIAAAPTAVPSSSLEPGKAFVADFSLPSALTAEEYVALSEEVVDVSRLLFAPLGLARHWKMPADGGDGSSSSSSSGDSSSSRPYAVEELREPWARTMDVVAEALYRVRGVSEGTVALSSHTLLDAQRNNDCLDAVRRSQAALDELVKPPLLLELNADSRIEDDSDSEETDSEEASNASGSGDGSKDSSDVQAEVSAAAEGLAIACQSLTGGHPTASFSEGGKGIDDSSDNALNATESDAASAAGADSGSRGWSGTYLGTVMALGFVLPGDKEANEVNQPDDNMDVASHPLAPAPTLEALLGQKKRVRHCVAALADCKKQLGCRYPPKTGPPLDAEEASSQQQQPRRRPRKLKWNQPILQAYAETTWDASSSTCDHSNNDASSSAVDGDEDKEPPKGGEGSAQLANAALTKGLVRAANSGLAARCIPASSSGSGGRNKNPAFWSEKRAAVADAATASQAATTAMATANEQAGDGVAAQAAVDAYSDAIAKAWGVLPYTRLASLLCSRAQARLLQADALASQAQAQSEASQGWFGGPKAAAKAEAMMEQANEAAAAAEVEVAWATRLAPHCTAVQRWKAELALRAACETLDAVQAEEDALIEGRNSGSGGDNDDDASSSALTAAEAACSTAVAALTQAFVADGSRDSALAQALEEGAKRATRRVARRTFKKLMAHDDDQPQSTPGGLPSSSSSSSSSASSADVTTDATTTTTPPPASSPLLPAHWVTKSFFAGFAASPPPWLPPPPSSKEGASVAGGACTEDEVAGTAASTINDIEDDDDDDNQAVAAGATAGAASATGEEGVAVDDPLEALLLPWRSSQFIEVDSSPTISTTTSSSSAEAVQELAHLLTTAARAAASDDHAAAATAAAEASRLGWAHHEEWEAAVVEAAEGARAAAAAAAVPLLLRPVAPSGAAKTALANHNAQVEVRGLIASLGLCWAAWALELHGTYAHLQCSFAESESSLRRASDFLARAVLTRPDDSAAAAEAATDEGAETGAETSSSGGGSEGKSESASRDGDSAAGRAVAWAEVGRRHILQPWAKSAQLRCQVKLACVRTDGTEEQKAEADAAFQVALDLADDHGLADPNCLKSSLVKEDPPPLASSHSKNGGSGSSTAAASWVNVSRVAAAEGAASSCGALMQRGQLRLLDNDLDGALQDLKQAKALCEAAVPLVSEAAEKAALTSTDKGDDDVTVGVFGGGWSGVLETLRRLESAAIGSLAVAYFKVDLVRHGGGALIGGLPPDLTRLLRQGAHKHPDQGEFLLLAGDLLAQTGDFEAGLANFKRAALACCPSSFPNDEDKTVLSEDPSSSSSRNSDVSGGADSLRLPPTSLPHGCPLPFVSAGRAYLQMNEPGRAEAHLQAALALDPRCAAAHLDLGQLRLQGGDMPAALTHFADARTHSRSFPELHDALACELVATAHQAALARLAASN